MIDRSKDGPMCDRDLAEAEVADEERMLRHNRDRGGEVSDVEELKAIISKLETALQKARWYVEESRLEALTSQASALISKDLEQIDEALGKAEEAIHE